MEDQFLKSYYKVTDLNNDIITGIQSLVGLQGMSPKDIVAKLPSIFWIEAGSRGEQYLCTIRKYGSDCLLTLTNSTSGVYTLEPIDFEPISLIGGHPHTRPGGPHH